MPNAAQLLTDLAKNHPAIFGALVGVPIGTGVGTLASEEGNRTHGAIGGGAVGAGVGAIGGMSGRKAQELYEMLNPTAVKAVTGGAILGGVMGGRWGKSQVAPWVKERMKEMDSEKEGAAMESAMHEKHESAAQEKSEHLSKKGKPPMEKKDKDCPGAKCASEEQMKEAATRVAAFDFGMDVWCKEHNVDKEAFAGAVKTAGLLPNVNSADDMALEALICLQAQANEPVQ